MAPRLMHSKHRPGPPAGRGKRIKERLQIATVYLAFSPSLLFSSPSLHGGGGGGSFTAFH